MRENVMPLSWLPRAKLRKLLKHKDPVIRRAAYAALVKRRHA